MDERDYKAMNRQENLDNLKLNLIRLADLNDILTLLDREEITMSKAAEMLNDMANKALRKMT